MQVGKRKGRVFFFEEKCRKSIWPGYGEPKVQLVLCQLERGDSCICQKCSVVAIYMQDSSQGQVETSLHCFALDVPQVLEKVG